MFSLWGPVTKWFCFSNHLSLHSRKFRLLVIIDRILTHTTKIFRSWPTNRSYLVSSSWCCCCHLPPGSATEWYSVSREIITMSQKSWYQACSYVAFNESHLIFAWFPLKSPRSVFGVYTNVVYDVDEYCVQQICVYYFKALLKCSIFL